MCTKHKAHLDEGLLHIAHWAAHVVRVRPELPVHLKSQQATDSLFVQCTSDLQAVLPETQKGSDWVVISPLASGSASLSCCCPVQRTKVHHAEARGTHDLGARQQVGPVQGDHDARVRIGPRWLDERLQRVAVRARHEGGRDGDVAQVPVSAASSPSEAASDRWCIRSRQVVNGVGSAGVWHMRMAVQLAGRLCVDMQSASAGGLAIAEAQNPAPRSRQCSSLKGVVLVVGRLHRRPPVLVVDHDGLPHSSVRGTLLK